MAPAPATPKVLPDEAREQMLSAYKNAESVIITLEHVLSHKKLSDSREQVVEDSLSGIPGARRPTTAIAEDVSRNVATIDALVLILVGEQPGHLVPLETPQEVAGGLRAFVGGLD